MEATARSMDHDTAVKLSASGLSTKHRIKNPFASL